MTLIDFSRDLEIVLREVSYTFSCNTSKVDCRLTSKEGAEASFTAYGYGSGVCAIDEVNKYIRQYFSSQGYFVVNQLTAPLFSNSMLPIQGIFRIKVNFSRKRICHMVGVRRYNYEYYK